MKRDPRGLQGHQFAVRGEAAEGQKGGEKARHGEGQGDDLRKAVEKEPHNHGEGDPLVDHEVRRLKEEVPRDEDHGEGRHAEEKGGGKLLQDVPVEKAEFF